MQPKPFAQLIGPLGRCDPFTARITSHRSGGANCKNDPLSAPPDFEPPPQSIETEEVTTP